MTVTPGSRVGAFEIVELVGSGGMGEVYRAHDARLGRDVAIKVIPASFAADADRVRRFEQEARAAAALTHPNILAVHDVGTHQSAPYIVSELLRGMTLRERISGGSLPVRKAIDIGVQIARGLAAAHQKNIVHRDLKPENVFVTDDGLVKILDFGLAKLTEAEAQPGDDAETRRADTQPGSVMGTAGYMSPEQLRGQPVDARSDIFSFGAVMYELLAGARAFRGETAMDVATAILKEDPPDLPTIERGVPPGLSRIVDRCLEKNPAARFQSAGDLAFALESLSTPSGATEVLPAAPRPRVMQWPVVAALGLIAGVVATYGAMTFLRPAEPTTDATAFPLTMPDGIVLAGGGPTGSSPTPLSISPDGRHLAILGVGADNVRKIWIRSRSDVTPRPIAGTDGAFATFWSPDSQQIGFYVPGQPSRLRRVSLAGGSPTDIGEVGPFLGGSWNADDVIIFGENTPGTGIQRVPAAGGTPAAVTTVADGEALHSRPLFLPDGKRFIFRAIAPQSRRLAGSARGPLFLASLDSTERTLIGETDSTNTVYSAGNLLYMRGQVLVAHPFDLAAGKFTSDAVPLVDGVQAYGGVPSGVFTASLDGVLAYQPGSVTLDSELRWFSREGTRGDRLGDAGLLADVRLSRDDSRAAYSRRGEGQDATSDIWIVDTATKLPNRFTFDSGNETSAVFSPDGREVIFNSTKKGRSDLYRKASDGTGSEQEVLVDEFDKAPVDWSPDGKYLLYIGGAVRGGAMGSRLWVLPLDGADRKPYRLTQNSENVGEAPGAFSPDSRFVTYAATNGSTSQIYISPVKPTGEKWQIADRGNSPRWSVDGTEIFFTRPGPNRLMSAKVDATGTAPKPLGFTELFPVTLGGLRRAFEPSRDGKRFLVNTPVGTDPAPARAPIVITNWLALRQSK